MLRFVRQSLYAKLSLVLLGVSLVGLLITAFLTQNFTVSNFEQYLLENSKQGFVGRVTNHYEQIGSWEGVMESVPSPPDRSSSERISNRPLNPNDGQPPPGASRIQGSHTPYALADTRGKIVVPAGEFELNSIASARSLAKGSSLIIDSSKVGTVLLTDNRVLLAPQIDAFRASVNRSLLLSAVSALIAALAIGILITRNLMRPIRALTDATMNFTKGQAQEVPIHSQDELGVLSKTFNQMTTDLKQAAQTRKQMTADIAHELRSPLTSLDWYLEAIQENAMPASKENMVVMQEQVKHLQHLVEDLRTLSLADTGELSLQLEPTNLNDFLPSIIQSYQAQADNRSIKLELDIEDNLPAYAFDLMRMKQVLSNLLDNAFRYTAASGSITLEAKQAKGTLELAVKDSGEGISPKKLTSIFERFYRADDARTHVASQSGLGLAIAKAIVEAHGGQIKAESTLNVGTRIVLTLSLV